MIGSAGTLSEPSGCCVIFVGHVPGHSTSRRRGLRPAGLRCVRSRRRYPSASSASRSEATNARGLFGPAAVEQAPDQRTADDDAVGAGRGLRGLGRGGDADAEQHRLVGHGLERRPICSACAASCSRSPVTPMQRDAVDEARASARRSRRAARRGWSARRAARSRPGRRRRRRPSRRARRAGGRERSRRRRPTSRRSAREALVPERARRGCSTSSRPAAPATSSSAIARSTLDRRRAEIERALRSPPGSCGRP